MELIVAFINLATAHAELIASLLSLLVVMINLVDQDFWDSRK